MFTSIRDIRNDAAVLGRRPNFLLETEFRQDIEMQRVVRYRIRREVERLTQRTPDQRRDHLSIIKDGYRFVHYLALVLPPNDMIDLLQDLSAEQIFELISPPDIDNNTGFQYAVWNDQVDENGVGMIDVLLSLFNANH